MLFILTIAIFSYVIHECAHGVVAVWCGDATPQSEHRITMDPRNHVSLWGSVVSPLLFLTLRLPPLGWIKRVPLNKYNLRNPRHDIVWISLAGSCANLAVASILSLVNRFIPPGFFLHQMVSYAGYFNVFLALIHLIPLPPLDGWEAAKGMVSYTVAKRMEHIEVYRFAMIAGFVFLGGFNRIVMPWSSMLGTILGFDRLF